MTSFASLIYKNILIALSSNEIANDQRHTIARSFITIQDIQLPTHNTKTVSIPILY